MPEGADDTLVVYSDYVCPFCYLGKHSLERYLDQTEDPPRVEWRPFDLRRAERGPDGEIVPGADTGKTEAYYQQAERNVERLADEYEVEVTWDVDRDVDAWDAHKLTLHARRHHDPETVEALRDAVFEALWRDGRDVGDRERLVELAEDAGLDADEARRAIDDPDLDEELGARFDEAHRAGVTGVPTFELGDLRVPGAVPPADIDTLVANARETADVEDA